MNNSGVFYKKIIGARTQSETRNIYTGNDYYSPMRSQSNMLQETPITFEMLQTKQYTWNQHKRNKLQKTMELLENNRTERDKWAQDLQKKEKNIHQRMEKTFNKSMKDKQEIWATKNDKRQEKF